MKIEEIRHAARMSQRTFASYFGIPLGTLRNWEQNISQPPPYVIDMIFQSIRRDKMINTETIKLIRIIEDLADLSNNGIEMFKRATVDNQYNKIFYDEKLPDANGHYRVVLDMCIDEIHHDVCSYYDSCSFDYSIRVVVPEDKDESPYISITFRTSNDEIIIENGRWYYPCLFQ